MGDKPKMTASQNAIVKKYTKRAAALGVPGSLAVHADMPFLTALWVAMLIELAIDSGLKITQENALKLVAALTATLTTLLIGLRLGGVIFKYTPATFFLITGVNCGANAACTFVIGRRIAMTFIAADFDAGKAAETIIKSLAWNIVHMPSMMGDIQDTVEFGRDFVDLGREFFGVSTDVADVATNLVVPLSASA